MPLAVFPFFQCNAVFFGKTARLFIGSDLRKINARILFDRIFHRKPFPLGEIDLRPAERHLQTAAGFDCNALIKFFHKVHHFEIIDVCLIHFHRGKFGVVRRIHPFVAEDSAQFVHLFKSAHDETFQIQFGLNSQVHVQIERVVMRFERPRVRPDLDGQKNGSVRFQEALFVEISANFADDFRTAEERFAHVFVHDQIDVTQAVFHIDVHKSVVFFGQR